MAISRYFPDRPVYNGEVDKPSVTAMVEHLGAELGGINGNLSFDVPGDDAAQTDETVDAKSLINNVRLQRTLMMMCTGVSRNCGLIKWTNHVIAIFAEPDPSEPGSAAAGGKVRITAYEPKQPGILSPLRPGPGQFAGDFYLNEAYRGSAVRFTYEEVPTIPLLRRALYPRRGNDMKMLGIVVFNAPLPQRPSDAVLMDKRGYFFPTPVGYADQPEELQLRWADREANARVDTIDFIHDESKRRLDKRLATTKAKIDNLNQVKKLLREHQDPDQSPEAIAERKNRMDYIEKQLSELDEKLKHREALLADWKQRDRGPKFFPERAADDKNVAEVPDASIIKLVEKPAEDGGAAEAAPAAAGAPSGTPLRAPGPSFGQGKPRAHVSNIHEAQRKFQIAKRMLYRATNSADSENPRLMASLRDALQKRYQTYLAFKEGMVTQPQTYKPWHRSNAENAARQARIEAAAEAPPRRHRKMAPIPSADELLKMKGGSKSSGFIQRMLAENSRYHYVNPRGKRRRAGHEWPVSKRRSYGWIRGTEAADEDETDPRGQPNYMTMQQILATYPPDSEERGRYLATLLDDTHPEMKEFRQFDPYGQQDWRNEMVERSDWITDKFPPPPSSSEDEGESGSDQEPPPDDEEEEDNYHPGHDPDPYDPGVDGEEPPPPPPPAPAQRPARRRGVSPVERRDLGPVVTGQRRPRRSKRLRGGAGGSGSETDGESSGSDTHARIHEEGRHRTTRRMRGGAKVFGPWMPYVPYVTPIHVGDEVRHRAETLVPSGRHFAAIEGRVVHIVNQAEGDDVLLKVHWFGNEDYDRPDLRYTFVGHRPYPGDPVVDGRNDPDDVMLWPDHIEDFVAIRHLIRDDSVTDMPFKSTPAAPGGGTSGASKIISPPILDMDAGENNAPLIAGRGHDTHARIHEEGRNRTTRPMRGGAKVFGPWIHYDRYVTPVRVGDEVRCREITTLGGERYGPIEGRVAEIMNQTHEDIWLKIFWYGNADYDRPDDRWTLGHRPYPGVPVSDDNTDLYGWPVHVIDFVAIRHLLRDDSVTDAPFKSTPAAPGGGTSGTSKVISPPIVDMDAGENKPPLIAGRGRGGKC